VPGFPNIAVSRLESGNALNKTFPGKAVETVDFGTPHSSYKVELGLVRDTVLAKALNPFSDWGNLMREGSCVGRILE